MGTYFLCSKRESSRPKTKTGVPIPICLDTHYAVFLALATQNEPQPGKYNDVSVVFLQGQFDLNELLVGEGAVLRRNTRLLSGASMDAYAMMLENTLVVSGDVLGAGTVWQVCFWLFTRATLERVMRYAPACYCLP
jgi:hypothetical protein